MVNVGIPMFQLIEMKNLIISSVNQEEILSIIQIDDVKLMIINIA